MGDNGPTLPGKPVRRIFTAEYKLAMIDAYEACTGTGEKGALLRREGLYSSHLVEWRKARDAGALVGLASQPRKRHRRATTVAPAAPTPAATPAGDAAALAKANRRIARLEADLARARLVIDIQGKAHALLEMLAESADTEPKPKP